MEGLGDGDRGQGTGCRRNRFGGGSDEQRFRDRLPKLESHARQRFGGEDGCTGRIN